MLALPAHFVNPANTHSVNIYGGIIIQAGDCPEHDIDVLPRSEERMAV
jgi:hypothetical protein